MRSISIRSTPTLMALAILGLGVPCQEAGHVSERVDDGVRLDERVCEGLFPELPRADEDRPESAALCAGDVGLEVVTDHPGHLRVGVERLERRAEERWARL